LRSIVSGKQRGREDLSFSPKVKENGFAAFFVHEAAARAAALGQG
jgi:hypothetical protein